MTTPLVQLQTPGGAVRGRDLRAPLRLTCDVVVVGSGAGGAMLARDTARAGLATVLIEEGGFHGPGDFTQREGEMLPRLFQEAGGRSTEDGAVMILSGKGVGGSTVHNTNLCKRAPDAVAAIFRQYIEMPDAPVIGRNVVLIQSLSPESGQVAINISCAQRRA